MSTHNLIQKSPGDESPYAIVDYLMLQSGAAIKSKCDKSLIQEKLSHKDGKGEK
jgi:hypothetical protein